MNKLVLSILCVVMSLSAVAAEVEAANKVQRAGAEGVFELHAKDATVHGEIFRYEPEPKKICLGYWTNPKDWAGWSFEVTEPGDYVVEVWQGCGKGHGGSDVLVEVGGSKFAFVVEDTGHFQNFKARKIGTVTLKAGIQKIAVKPQNKKAGAVMDIRFVKLHPVSVE